MKRIHTFAQTHKKMFVIKFYWLAHARKTA